MRLPLPAMICMFILCLFSEWTCAMPLALDTPRIDEIVHAENAAPKFSPTPIPSVAVRDGNSEKLQSFRQWQTEPSIHKRKSSLMSRLEVRFLTQEEIMEDTKLPEGIRKFAQEEFIQYHGNVTSTTTTTAAAKIQEQAKSIIRSHLLWNLPYGENGMLYFGEKKHTRTLIFPDDNSKLQYPFSSIPDSGVAYEIHDRREESLGPCKPRCHGAAWISKTLDMKCEGNIYDWSQSRHGEGCLAISESDGGLSWTHLQPLHMNNCKKSLDYSRILSQPFLQSRRSSHLNQDCLYIL